MEKLGIGVIVGLAIFYLFRRLLRTVKRGGMPCECPGCSGCGNGRRREGSQGVRRLGE